MPINVSPTMGVRLKPSNVKVTSVFSKLTVSVTLIVLPYTKVSVIEFNFDSLRICVITHLYGAYFLRAVAFRQFNSAFFRTYSVYKFHFFLLYFLLFFYIKKDETKDTLPLPSFNRRRYTARIAVFLLLRFYFYLLILDFLLLLNFIELMFYYSIPHFFRLSRLLCSFF